VITVAAGTALSVVGGVVGGVVTAPKGLTSMAYNSGIKKIVESFDDGVDVPSWYTCLDTSHWFIYVESKDRSRRAIYTLSGDTPKSGLRGLPLVVEELLFDPDKTDKGYTSEEIDGFKSDRDEENFSRNYNRCNWHFLDKSRFKSWTKTLKAVRSKVRMINSRKDDNGKPWTYNLRNYNCQTTSRELALVIADSPCYLSFRMSSIAWGI